MENETRKDVLLKATYDLLKQCEASRYVENILAMTATWDGTECDGCCLMNEIADELGIDDDGF